MASYLRPRRGKKATAESQAIVLKKGEVFFEINANGISTGSSAKACGKIKMGDGSTTYSNLGYFIDVDTSVIAFTDTATATAAAQGDQYYSQLNAIAPTATVKSIFGNVKSLLYKMATNLTELNNESGGGAAFSFITTTLSASSWNSSKQYSFESTYPSSKYNIDVTLAPTATDDQIRAAQDAIMMASATTNVITAHGDVPTINIPVILRLATQS